MPKLDVVVLGTRPGRAGLPVAQWFLERARAHGKFETELVDLKEVNLPFLDETKHPRLGQYDHEHTKRWSASVAAADAFVFVTPEYNFSTPPTLLNALNYLFREWHYKPAGFVSYGGVSGGLRSTQMSKLALTTLKIVPMVEQVSIPFVAKHVNEGVFSGDEHAEKAATVLLDELLRWASALKALR